LVLFTEMIGACDDLALVELITALRVDMLLTNFSMRVQGKPADFKPCLTNSECYHHVTCCLLSLKFCIVIERRDD